MNYTYGQFNLSFEEGSLQEALATYGGKRILTEVLRTGLNQMGRHRLRRRLGESPAALQVLDDLWYYVIAGDIAVQVLGLDTDRCRKTALALAHFLEREIFLWDGTVEDTPEGMREVCEAAIETMAYWLDVQPESVWRLPALPLVPPARERLPS